ncbi:MAG: pyruvate ferredoxin oxidoreductase [Bacteroidaceae bacterium]|jgi:hypothetical protein|nr:pyruvate ferredoxin oxidoreductase [Bacteroidaceae bacterium]
MDYKYIEQLLERYWECQTTLEEEAILRTFFRQEDVPASLLPYRQLFLEEDEMAGEHLSKDFQDKMLRMVGEEPAVQVCKARRVTFMRRCRPFYRAAGLIAILLTIGNAAHQSFTDDGQQASDNGQPSLVNSQWSMVNDSIASRPEQQSAELKTLSIDTLDAFPR